MILFGLFQQTIPGRCPYSHVRPRVVARSTRERWQADCPTGWYCIVIGDRWSEPLPGRRLFTLISSGRATGDDRSSIFTGLRGDQCPNSPNVTTMNAKLAAAWSAVKQWTPKRKCCRSARAFTALGCVRYGTSSARPSMSSATTWW